MSSTSMCWHFPTHLAGIGGLPSGTTISQIVKKYATNAAVLLPGWQVEVRVTPVVSVRTVYSVL